MFSIVQKKVSSKKAPPSIKHGALQEKQDATERTLRRRGCGTN